MRSVVLAQSRSRIFTSIYALCSCTLVNRLWCQEAAPLLYACWNIRTPAHLKAFLRRAWNGHFRTISALALRITHRWGEEPQLMSEHVPRLLGDDVWHALPYWRGLREFHLWTNLPYIDNAIYHTIGQSRDMLIFSYCYDMFLTDNPCRMSHYGDLPLLGHSHLSAMFKLQYLQLRGMATYPGHLDGVLALVQPSFRLKHLALVDCALNDREFRGLLSAQAGR